jgi:hypothetical protein
MRNGGCLGSFVPKGAKCIDLKQYGSRKKNVDIHFEMDTK